MDKEDSEDNDATVQSDDTYLDRDSKKSSSLDRTSFVTSQLSYSCPISCTGYSSNSDTLNHRSTYIKKLDEQEHFHYTSVNIRHIFLRLAAVHFESSSNDHELLIEVASNDNVWIVKRSYSQLVEFDYQLHRCVFDRSYSKLRELGRLSNVTGKSFRIAVEKYFQRLSQLTAKSITCFPILRFLEVDNRGNRFLPAEETCINTPAIATAIVTKNYASKNNFEISLSVGDIVSIIEKRPPNSDGISWWKAKLTIASSDDDLTSGFKYKVGLFPSDCVQLLDSKSTTPNTSLKAKPKRVVRPRERSLIRVFLRRSSPQRIIPVFGTDLVEYLQKTGYDVPIILKKCVEVIERYGIVTGVYRQCGIQSNVQKLRNAFDTGLISEVFTEGILRDVHCVSSLLKQYFRQLPNPLFTFTLYSQFVVAYETRDDTRNDKFKNVIEQLPTEHYRTAKFLISHLAKLSRCAHLTDMNSKNLAIVWAPNLFRPPPCPTNNDIHALQGLNVQTGLCNYIILHAVHLFSLDDTVTTFVAPEDHFASSLNERKSSVCLPDAASYKNNEINGCSSSSVLKGYQAVTNNTRNIHDNNKKKPVEPTPSTGDDIAASKRHWKGCTGSSCNSHPSSDDIKWRRCLSPENNDIRTSRSTSLITFVAKSVEEFRNGMFYGWRAKNACNRRNTNENSAKESSALPSPARYSTNKSLTNSVNSHLNGSSYQHSTLSRNYDLMPSTSAELGHLCNSQRHASESSMSSRCGFSSLKDGDSSKQNSQRESFKRRQVVFDDKPSQVLNNNCAKAAASASNSVSSSFRSSVSDESLQLDISRYDNVTPQTRGVDRLRLAETPLSFYDLPQDNISNCQSNIQFYYL